MGYLKHYKMLGMNSTMDQHILHHYPGDQVAIEEPFYKGAGNCLVQELENLCERYKDYCHQQAIIKNELIKEIKSL